VVVSVFTPILDEMNRKAKRLLFTTETHEVFVIRNGREKVGALCDKCGCEVEVLDLDKAVSLSQKSAREIFEIEKGEIHSIEISGSHLLVCCNS